MKHVAARVWMAEGRAMRLPDAISSAFDDHVSALPWAGTTGLDWTRMPRSEQFDAANSSAVLLRAWIGKTRIGRRANVAVWYSRAEGGIVVPLHLAVESLDELYRDAPGPRFAFGVDVDSGTIHPAFGDILQYGYGELLVALV